MRSHYDDFAAGETNKLSGINTTNYNNHSSNLNNNNYNNNNNNSNGAIPYHARENSLPFSYGQISKTSTPLRPTHINATTTSTSSTSTLSRNYSSNNNNNKNGNEYDFDFDFDFGLNSTGRSHTALGLDYGYGKTTNNQNNNKNNSALNGSGGGISGVKDVNFDLLTQQNERDRERNNFYGGLNNHNFKNSEKYLNESCTQSVKYNNQSGFNNNNHNFNNNSIKTTDETDASMIKSQPRLTSPLLVRKTLSNGSNNHISSSRSPTRSTTNTIANTYHYSFGNNGNNNKNGNIIGDNNFDKFGLNGNINNNDNYGHRPTTTAYGSGTGGVGGANSSSGDILLAKTPARHDFDELLRERREKVFNEYRTTSTTTYDLSSSPKVSPVPPPRRFANGTVQLPSTLPPSLSNKALYPPQIPNRSQSQNSKYNYDIEFNLNLNEQRYEDEVDNVDILRRRTNTIDSLPQRQQQPQQHQPYGHHKQQLQHQQQQQLYQTRDIPLASPYVERNYHTISSSSTTTATTHAKNSNNNYGNRETLSPTSMLDIYSTPYDERNNTNKQRSNMMMQPLEATTASSSSASTTLQRTQRSTDYATYGNGNMYGHEHTNLGQTMTDRESSPIYATSTKKVTTTSSLTAAAASPAYRHSGNNTNNNNGSITATSTTTLNMADYPSPTAARPETPAFPVTPRTPFAAGGSAGAGSNGYNSQTTTLSKHTNGSYQQHVYQPANAVEHNYSTETIYGTNYRPRLNSSLSMANSEPQEVAAHLVKFAKDSSKFWYKPNLSRDEAISLLINAAPGTFVVRDSTTYKNAYGLVLRVAQPPPDSTSTGKPDELVRHFLIEPTTRGVRLKGCANEPVFTSLSALVYEHSINQLALPCLLHIPERDLVPPLVEHTPAQKQLLTQGAACNVLWLFSCDTESLTGEEAIRKAIRQMYALPAAPTPTEVHFKVTQQGITLTDNTRKKFFRKHYTADIISFCAIDPDHRLWTMQEHGNDNTTVVGSLKKTIFAFVARRSASSKDNQCHIFCDLAINQPASAIVSFVNKTLPTEKQKNYVL